MSKEKPVEDNSQKVAEDSKQIAEKKPDLDFTALEPMVLMSASPGEFNEIDGTQDGDLLYGTTAKDLVEGLEGDDTILSGEGDDRIFGGAGKDTVLGGDGDDKIFGGDDNDYLAGQGGNNVIDAGAGDDTIQLGDGHDVVDGGEGIDLVELHNASGDVEVDMSDGSISGGLSAEISNVEAVVGSDHNDTYRFSDPSDGDVYFVYGLEGTNSLDLSQFSQGDLTMSAGTIQGPAGEGTFTIYYAEVAEIILADGTVAYEGEHIQWPEEYRGVLGGIGEEMGLFDEAPDSDGPLIGIEPPEGEESEPPVANNPDPTQNEDPTAVDDEYTFDEDTVLNGNVLTNDSDSDGDDLELFRIIQAPANGQIVANSDGSFEYTPNEHYFGSDFFTYEVVDRNGGSETATVRLNILPVNDAPEATNQTRTINEDSTLNGSVLQFASDIENDALEVTRLTQQPTVGTIEFDSNGDFRYVPDPDVNGVDSFTFEISDGNGGFTELTYTVNITPVADAPRAADDSFTIQEDTTAQGNVLTNDLEVDGEEITVSQITSRPENGHVTIDTNGNFIYTPKPNFHGVDRFEYEIVDETGLTSTAEVVLNVVSQNDGPDVINEQYDMAADEPLVANVLDNDSDVEGDTLSIQQVLTQPQNGSLDIDEDGRFTYIPDVGFEGTEVFQYVVSDGNGGTAVGTVTIEVEQAESVVIDDGEEEEEVESDNSDAIIKPSESLKNIIVGAIPVNEEGDPEGGVGTDVDVVDANETTIEELVSRMLGTGITVTDASLTSGANEQIGFITNMNTSMPGVTSFDEGLIISSGNVSSIGGPNTYDNTSGYMAHESYSYSKGQSTDANLGTVFDLSVLRIEFIPEGDKISGNYIFGSEEYIEYTNAGFNDNAAVILNGENISRTPDGQLLSIDTVNKDVNSHLFVDNDTGTSMGGVGNDAALNSPAPYYTEMDGFTKTLQFKHEVTPGEVNVLELKIGDVGDNAWDSWMIFEAESVRSNAIDMDLKELFEFPETSKEFSFTAQLTNGDPLPDYLSLNGDRLEGELPDDGTVDLNIEVTITDEDGNTSTVNFKIVSENLADNDVENVESDASVNDDSYTLDEGNILTISDPAEGLLANDRDADGDTLAVQTTPASQPANGSVTLNSNGTFTYTPNPDFHGTDSFEYTVVDSSGSEATATAEIVVGEIENDIGEVALTMYIEAGEDSTVGLTIPDRYEAEDVEYRISGLPAGATFTNGLDLGDGQWRVRGGELQGLRIVTADGVQTGEYQLIVESSFRSGSDLLTDELDAAEDDWKISDGVSNGSSAEDGVLGPFTGTGGEQGVFRTFEVGDRVQSVVIEFDFHEIDSWDGEDFMVFANDKLITADPFYNGEHSNGNAHYGDDHDRPYSVALGEEFTSGKSSWSDQVHRYRIVV
ncbi:MAG: tandem-95 repeat protein [Planctomycetota bacterium]